ncbi:MAG: hypothetical protein WC390_06580 [Sulfurimonas sp.]|jgi:hypothetical protein
MIATITLDNIFSGFIGSVFGTLFAVLIAWWNAWRHAKHSLMGRLIDLKSFDIATVVSDIRDLPKDEWRTRYSVTYRDILKDKIIYEELLPFFCRTKIQKAWEEYQGTPEKVKNWFPDSKTNPVSKEDFGKRINSLLDAVGYKKHNC